MLRNIQEFNELIKQCKLIKRNSCKIELKLKTKL